MQKTFWHFELRKFEFFLSEELTWWYGNGATLIENRSSEAQGKWDERKFIEFSVSHEEVNIRKTLHTRLYNNHNHKTLS